MTGDRAREREIDPLIERYLPGLRAFVRLRTGPELRSKEASTDLVQSVCREVLQHADRFQHDGERGFKRWLYQTALRKIANRAEFYHAERRDVRREQVADDANAQIVECYASFCTPSRDASAREQLARIENAFDTLSNESRDIVIGSRLLGMSHAELAAKAGKTEGAVRTMLSRAIARLAELLDQSAD